jgi:CDP-4-dehydro-6-deoxyglucose reductase, E3
MTQWLTLWRAAQLGGVARGVLQSTERAFARRVRERTLPRQQVLAQRLFTQSQELTDARRQPQRYHDLLTAPAVAADSGPPSLRELKVFAENGLAEVLATESAAVLSIMDTR